MRISLAFVRAKLHVVPAANIGIDVGIKPVSFDVRKLGKYYVVFKAFFFLNIPTDCLTLSLSVSLSYYSCDV